MAMNWEESAHHLIQRYRRGYDYEAARRVDGKDIRQPVEAAELASHVASQVMVGLLVPRVHPFVPRFSNFLRLSKHGLPQQFMAPLSGVFASGIQTKTLVDILYFWQFFPEHFHTTSRGHQPPPSQLINPFSSHGLELNILGTLLGVLVGRFVVAVREILLGAVDSAAALCQRSSITSVAAGNACSFTASFLRTTTILAVHLAGCIIFAPCVVRGLASLLQEAQSRRRSLFHTAFRSVSRRIPKLFQRVRREALYWDEPKDGKVPVDLLCPITGSLFVSPVVLHGVIFEEAPVRHWVEETSRHPTLQGIRCATSELEYAPDVADLCSDRKSVV